MTWTVTVFVLGPWLSLGLQLNRPVATSKLIPVGLLSREYVSRLGGRSESLALKL
jgi:hypothetical protein